MTDYAVYAVAAAPTAIVMAVLLTALGIPDWAVGGIGAVVACLVGLAVRRQYQLSGRR